jgi:hypothetical protein
VHGGFWERAVSYTPTAVVAQFQHGLIRLDVVLIATVLIATVLLLASIWMRIGTAVRRRVYESLGAADLAVAAISGCTLVRASWDTSENRMNSVPVATASRLIPICFRRTILCCGRRFPARLDSGQRLIAPVISRITWYLRAEISTAAYLESADEQFGEFVYVP